MKGVTAFGVLAAGVAFHAPVSAQYAVRHVGAVDQRASVALTIPFGGKKAAESRPRMDLVVSQDRVRVGDRSLDFVDRNHRPLERRIGVTLDRNPTLMVNGRAVDAGDKRFRFGTAGYVVVGVVVAAAVGVLVLNDALDDASE